LADDTTLFFNFKTEIPLALNEIEMFGSSSELIMNKDKKEGLWFPYYSVSFYFIRFIIPNKFEAFAIYFFPIFFWNNTGTSHICKDRNG
jgi:hypothetical protein